MICKYNKRKILVGQKTIIIVMMGHVILQYTMEYYLFIYLLYSCVCVSVCVCVVVLSKERIIIIIALRR